MAAPTPDQPPATPAWVKAIAVIGLIALTVIIAVVLSGGHAPPIQHAP